MKYDQLMIDPAELDKFQAHPEEQFIISPHSIREKIHDTFGDKKQLGHVLPWQKTHAHFAFLPGGVTVWAGINGHRKSMVTTQVAAWLAKDSMGVCIASLELMVEETMHRMIRQMAGRETPSPAYVDQLITWLSGRMWLYDQTDTVKPDRIIALCKLVSEQYAVDHIFIDSLMKCGVGRDNDAQAEFMDQLCWAAKATGMHIHLIHHIRKGQEMRVPTKWDIRGAGEITDLASNVIIVYKQDDEEEDFNALLCIEKQRYGSFEGRFGFSFDEESLQLTASPGKKMMWKTEDVKLEGAAA